MQKSVFRISRETMKLAVSIKKKTIYLYEAFVYIILIDALTFRNYYFDWRLDFSKQQVHLYV